MTPDPLALELWDVAVKALYDHPPNHERFTEEATRILARARAEEAEHLGGEYYERAGMYTGEREAQRDAQPWVWAWKIAHDRAAELRKVSDGK